MQAPVANFRDDLHVKCSSVDPNSGISAGYEFFHVWCSPCSLLQFRPSLQGNQTGQNIRGAVDSGSTFLAYVLSFTMDLYDRVSHQRESEYFYQSDAAHLEHPTLGSPFMQTDIVFSPDLPSPPNEPFQIHSAASATERPSFFKYYIKRTISSTTNFFSDFADCPPQSQGGPISFSKRVKKQ